MRGIYGVTACTRVLVAFSDRGIYRLDISKRYSTFTPQNTPPYGVKVLLCSSLGPWYAVATTEAHKTQGRGVVPHAPLA